jgi:hypothetical protein
MATSCSLILNHILVRSSNYSYFLNAIFDASFLFFRGEIEMLHIKSVNRILIDYV